jgi:hypothetical protein
MVLTSWAEKGHEAEQETLSYCQTRVLAYPGPNTQTESYYKGGQDLVTYMGNLIFLDGMRHSHSALWQRLSSCPTSRVQVPGTDLSSVNSFFPL